MSHSELSAPRRRCRNVSIKQHFNPKIPTEVLEAEELNESRCGNWERETRWGIAWKWLLYIKVHLSRVGLCLWYCALFSPNFSKPFLFMDHQRRVKTREKCSVTAQCGSKEPFRIRHARIFVWWLKFLDTEMDLGIKSLLMSSTCEGKETGGSLSKGRNWIMMELWASLSQPLGSPAVRPAQRGCAKLVCSVHFFVAHFAVMGCKLLFSPIALHSWARPQAKQLSVTELIQKQLKIGAHLLPTFLQPDVSLVDGQSERCRFTLIPLRWVFYSGVDRQKLSQMLPLCKS